MIKGASAPSDELVGLLKDELNVKEITWEPGGELGVEFDLNINDELRQEGWARELIRQIQDLRKEAGYGFADRIAARWQSDDPAVLTMLARWGESVKSNSGLSDLGKSDDQADLKIFRDLEIGDNKKIWLGLAN
ncbi:MAG: Isoleucine-tRNA ligase [Parcubacteria group bacterium GW2011_GWA1_47_11]|nr:MAG: Isoleucine-tRNA ligase [Parcubacteria group bacterium GW2011_GWA1_47_11]